MNQTCCVFGHRKTNYTPELSEAIHKTAEKLITKENVTTFLFGSKSRFDDICYDTITLLKEKYPHIKRVYVRAEYQHIDDKYRAYLLKSYEDTYFPDCVVGAGRLSYIKRNFEMIDKSKFCMVFYDTNKISKSGTKIAYDYALKRGKYIYNFA